jgi:mycothiol synthase
MALSQRMFHSPTDWASMLAIAQAQGDHLHTVDLPYRLCSWAFDEPANCAIWEQSPGEMVAWAVVQSPFWCIDYAVHPAAPPDMLHPILAWADERAKALQGTHFARPCWFINGFKDHPDEAVIEGADFRSQANVGEDSWTKVLFQRANQSPVERALPAGFAIRPLGGASEAAAYVALHRATFGSENMTIGWRERTLQHPAYRPELDLVLIDAENQLAGFCIGWLAAHGPGGTPAGQIEPMGVRADLQGQGLGQALLNNCLARLLAAGARSLFVETDNYRNAAFKLYQSAGFEVQREVIVYRKDYE